MPGASGDGEGASSTPAPSTPPRATLGISTTLLSPPSPRRAPRTPSPTGNAGTPPFPMTPPRAVSATASVNVSTRLDSPRSQRAQLPPGGSASDRLAESLSASTSTSTSTAPSSDPSRASTPAPGSRNDEGLLPTVSAPAPASALSASRPGGTRTRTPSHSRSRSSTHSRSQSRSQSYSSQPSHSRSQSNAGTEAAPEATVEDVAALDFVAAGDTDARRELRELVGAGGTPARAARAVPTEDATYSPRRYYVLTNAGKPVFSIGHDDETLTNMMGVAQALISIFAADDDRPRTILHGRTRTTFLLKPPLYLFAVSDWGEPDYVLRMHLEYINLQILSVVSAVQLARAFQRRSNFDLSRLLEGSEPFLRHLVAQCQDDQSFLTTTLQPLRMAPALRDTAAAALTPPAKFNDLLYVLLIAGGRIVTLLRPRRHTVHPSDMHLLLNTLATSATLRTVETWLPICLPKFNPAGFVHAYISYIRDDVGLVFISADRDAFEPLCGWRESVVETLKKNGALDRIEASIKTHPYTVAAVGSPGLRHFVYKSRGIVQLTTPEWEEPYTAGSDARARLVTLYENVQDALYARSGQPMGLKLVYMANAHEAVLGWLTKPFELYVAVSPHLPMNAVVGTANRVAKWVNSEESRLFLKDAPVF